MKRLFVVLGVLVALVAGPAFAATLDWTDNSNNELGFEVYRETTACSAPDTFVKVGQVGANVKTFLDATTVIGNQYCYEVRAFNNTLLDGSGVLQYSGFSNKAGIAYPLPAVAPPTGLAVAP